MNKEPHQKTNRKQISINTTKEKIDGRKKRQIGHFYGLLAAITILVILLMNSFSNSVHLVNTKNDTSELTIEKGYALKNNSTENSTHMLSWFYFEKNKVNKQDLQIVQPFISKLYESNVYTESLPQISHSQLLLEMSDGRVAQVAVINGIEDRQYSFVDVNTKQSLPITIDEAIVIDLMIYNYADRKLVGIFEIVLSGFLIVLCIVTMIEISPRKKEKLHFKKARYYFLAGIATYIVYIFVSGLSLYYFNAYNGLFIASIMTALLLLKTFTEYYNGHFERSILEVPVFFIFVLLFTFIRCV